MPEINCFGEKYRGGSQEWLDLKFSGGRQVHSGERWERAERRWERAEQRWERAEERLARAQERPARPKELWECFRKECRCSEESSVYILRARRKSPRASKGGTLKRVPNIAPTYGSLFCTNGFTNRVRKSACH